jgi:phosphotriesterase-related protein
MSQHYATRNRTNVEFMKINSVMGPLDTADLGPTFMHEHVCCADWSLRMAFGDRFFEFDKVVEQAVAQYSKMKRETGITTIVDGTPINLGRDVNLIRAVAAATGLNFIVSSGFYWQPEPGLASRPEDEIVDLLLGECENGIGGTGIKPGIMKTAVEKPGLNPYLRKILHAVGRVAAQAHLPIFCHHNPGLRDGGDILDIFEDAGVKPNRVIMGHSGDSDDIAYLTGLLDRGAYIGEDRFGYCDLTLSLKRRVATIATLCERGHANRIFLAHDLAAYLAMGSDMGEGRPDFTFIHTQVLPALINAGVTQDQIDTMLSANPRAFFEGR